MIIPVEALPKAIMISMLIAELFLIAIPLLIILAYRQKNALSTRTLWFGMGLAILTCIKFLFLMKQQLFSNWEPFYSISIIVLVEAIVREWIIRRWNKWNSRPEGVQFVMGYLFAKLLGIGTSVFLFFTWIFARLSYKGPQADLNTETFQQAAPYIQLVLHSLFNLGYMFLLFVFIILRLKISERPRWYIALTEVAFLLAQGFLLISINNPSIPIIPMSLAVLMGTISLGYFAKTSINELQEKPSNPS